ncbi:MAG: hypothetical protein U1G07_24280 [Verrucomicrobiota bacterium]
MGQTLDGMRVWDIRRAVQALRSVEGYSEAPVVLEASGEMGVNALYAALFEPRIEQLVLSALPESHQAGPDYLNVLRFLDIPQAVAMVAEKSRLELRGSSPAAWAYPVGVAGALGWERRIVFR